jgi:glycosyltransferase involved in cell wall biosynthesis
MEKLKVPAELRSLARVEVYGRTVGDELRPHFDWADLVVSPGDVGLLVTNAARHGKGILIDADSDHGPEYWLAKEANQPFISFGDVEVVYKFVEEVLTDRVALRHWGETLQAVAKSEYTVEQMVQRHIGVFHAIANSGRSKQTLLRPA